MIAPNESLVNGFASEYLINRGIDNDLANKCGLRYVTRSESKKLTGHDIGGLLIPYYCSEGKQWINRLRPLDNDWDNNPKKKQDYIERHGKLPKFLSKKGDKNKPYLPPFLDWKKIFNKPSEEIIITEGEIKAINACKHGIATIALSGVNNFVNSTEDGKSEFLPELDQIKWKGRSVGICFDSDIISNSAVQYAAQKLINILVEKKANPYLIVLPRELNGDKNGIDDFITRHGGEAFKQVIHWHKVWDDKGEKHTKILRWDSESQKYSYNKFEPINSIKGLLAWSVLKENWKYRPNFGWCQWNGKYWEIPNDGKNGENTLIQQVKEFCCQQNWLNNNNHKLIFEEVTVRLFDNKTQWNPPNILGFNNGYLDTDTNEFLPFIKDSYVTSILPFDYEPEAIAEQWENFLNFTFNGDKDKIQYIRAWLRWILTPKNSDEDYPIEATLWLVGKPGLGKGTFLSVLQGLCGRQNVGIFEPGDINDANKLFSLVDKKVSINNDTEGFIPNIPLYNSICSNEPINVKHLYHDVFPTRLNTVTVLAMNKEVAFKGAGSEGLSRRLHVIKFDNPPPKIDTDLKKKLRGELSGIFSWVWGLSIEQTKQILKWRITEDVSEVYGLSHPEIQFLREIFPDGNEEIQASHLYKQYEEWCVDNGYEKQGRRNFGYLMKQIDGVICQEKRDANYYIIPEMKNYLEIKDNHTTNPSDIVEDCGGLWRMPVEGQNPYSISSVEGVEEKSEKFFLKEKNIEEDKKVIDLTLHTLHDHIQQDFAPSTQPSTQPSTPHVTPEDSAEKYDQLMEFLPEDYIKSISDYEFEMCCKNEWFKWMLQPERDKILAIRNKKVEPEKVANNSQEKKEITHPIKQEKSKRQINMANKPRQPEFNLSDVLPHLERGTGKHKRNYVCPCCNSDYLSVNPNKGYKCFNPESNCDTKAIFKEFVNILKDHDPQWRQYQYELEQSQVK